MKIEITITKHNKGFLGTDEQIAEIEICNGNWRYHDNLMEGYDKVSITINTINQAHYLHYPVKDAYPIHDYDKALEDNLQVVNAVVRTYDNLLSYLNCRINNLKEDYKKYGWTDRTYNIVMFEESRDYDDISKDIVFDQKSLLEVKITKVE